MAHFSAVALESLSCDLYLGYFAYRDLCPAYYNLGKYVVFCNDLILLSFLTYNLIAVMV